MTRCRIGHGRLTHSYLLNNEEQPECILCNSNHSLKHNMPKSKEFYVPSAIIACVDVADVRQTFYNVNNLYDLFTNVTGDTILKIIKKKLICIQKYSPTRSKYMYRLYSFIFLMFLLFVHIIRLFYRQVCFIIKDLVGA